MSPPLNQRQFGVPEGRKWGEMPTSEHDAGNVDEYLAKLHATKLAAKNPSLPPDTPFDLPTSEDEAYFKGRADERENIETHKAISRGRSYPAGKGTLDTPPPGTPRPPKPKTIIQQARYFNRLASKARGRKR